MNLILKKHIYSFNNSRVDWLTLDKLLILCNMRVNQVSTIYLN
jgi:hypothetical protein